MNQRSSPTRRVRALADAGSRTSVEHVGLAHEKLAPHSTDDDKEAKARFIRNLAGNSTVPRGYGFHFRRWVRRTPAHSEGPLQRRVAVFASQGRVLCGMGERTPTENGLSIHTTYGVPYLPGSSLKGITRAWVIETVTGGVWKEGETVFRDVFGAPPHEEEDGDGGLAACVSFLDALWVPGDPSLPERPWAAEILTPHFGDYYKEAKSPDGTQSPVPVTFLAAQGGFRVVLEGPGPLIDHVMQLLEEALLERGVGAKGRSGYGRFVRHADETRDDEQEKRARNEKAEEKRRGERLRRIGSPVEMLEELNRQPGVDLRAEVVAWLTGSERAHPSMQRFPLSPPAAKDVFEWARGAGFAKGLKARLEGAPEEVRQALTEEPLPAALSKEQGGFGPNHLDRFDDPSDLSAKKAKEWPNHFAQQIARGRYDEDTVRRALAHLADHGGGKGHRKVIASAYGLEIE